MGYHVIVRNSEKGLISHYITELDELADLDGLSKDTIIYQGERTGLQTRISIFTLQQPFFYRP